MNSGTTASIQTNNGGEKKKLHFEWLWPLLIRPKKTIEEIVKQDKSVWLTPLLVISILAILAGLIANPIRRTEIVTGANLPENFQYYSSDQQAEFMNAQATQSSALFTLVFPVLGSLLGIWVGWFLLSSIFHLVLTLTGSRASNIHSYNLIGWSMLPIGVRTLVQILAMLFSHSLVHASGLAGFIDGSAGGGLAFLYGFLGQIDVYFVWQVVLILLGVIPLSGLARAKAWTATAISVAILMVLLSLPHILSTALSGLSTGGIFF